MDGHGASVGMSTSGKPCSCSSCQRWLLAKLALLPWAGSTAEPSFGAKAA